MRVGLIARADRTGLAAQTWSFWRNMHPDATLVVDLARCSGQAPEMDRYAGDPNVTVWSPHPRAYPSIEGFPENIVAEFLNKVDVVFSAETPYNLWLFQRAREVGVRTVLQINYEFADWILHDGIPEPDCFALPTLWHEADIRAKLPGREIVHLPVPVDRELLPYKPRTELRTILHTAGTPAMEDRNGTQLLIEAMRHVRSPVQAVVKTQKVLSTNWPHNVAVEGATANFWELYGDQDLYVMPRKFGGLCLPQQEAMSVGMPTLMSDCHPQNTLLPPELLVPVQRTKEIMTRAMIGVHEAYPVHIAERIDWLYEHPGEFRDLSSWCDEWASAHSWTALRPLYDAVLAGN